MRCNSERRSKSDDPTIFFRKRRVYPGTDCVVIPSVYRPCPDRKRNCPDKFELSGHGSRCDIIDMGRSARIARIISPPFLWSWGFAYTRARSSAWKLVHIHVRVRVTCTCTCRRTCHHAHSMRAYMQLQVQGKGGENIRAMRACGQCRDIKEEFVPGYKFLSGHISGHVGNAAISKRKLTIRYLGTAKREPWRLKITVNTRVSEPRERNGQTKSRHRARDVGAPYHREKAECGGVGGREGAQRQSSVGMAGTVNASTRRRAKPVRKRGPGSTSSSNGISSSSWRRTGFDPIKSNELRRRWYRSARSFESATRW